MAVFDIFMDKWRLEEFALSVFSHWTKLKISLCLKKSALQNRIHFRRIQVMIDHSHISVGRG